MHSSRLQYDQPAAKDFERFYAIHADPENNLFNPAGAMDRPTAVTAFDRLLQHWNEHGFGPWAIKLIGSETIMGFGGLSFRMYGEALKLNVGYRFDKAFWGYGYATELLVYTINYGFNTLQKGQLFAIVRPTHIASIKVLEKCAMQLTGTLDDVPGQDHSLVYSIEK